MARHIEYDRVKVRQKLLEAFWGSGFAETSLSDLEAASGLSRRQLYNGPGDKKAMFLQALDDFDDVAGRMFLAPLEAETAGVADIERLLSTFVDLAETGEAPGGCMVCSASQEEIARDPDVRSRLDAYFRRIEHAYRNALTRAQSRREIADPPEAIAAKASLLFSAHVAICILGRAGCDPGLLRRIKAGAMASLA